MLGCSGIADLGRTGSVTPISNKWCFCNREDLRKSVGNSSRHDRLGYSVPLRRSRFRLQHFGFAVPRRRIRDERFKKMMRGMGYVIDRAIECFFVCARWLCKSGKLPNKLERRSANLVIRRWWRKIMQGLDSSAHL